MKTMESKIARLLFLVSDLRTGIAYEGCQERAKKGGFYAIWI